MNGIKCPKCGSNQIHSDKKGFSIGKAVAGTLVGGVLVGAAAGEIGSNKIEITCLNCGHKFKPGQGGLSISENELNNLPNTDSANLYSWKERIFGEKDNSKYITPPPKVNQKAVCLCGSINEMHFRFCRVYGRKIDISTAKTIKNGQAFDYEKCHTCNRLTPKFSNKCKFCTNCGVELID